MSKLNLGKLGLMIVALAAIVLQAHAFGIGRNEAIERNRRELLRSFTPVAAESVAQPDASLWAKTYGGPAADMASVIEQTGDGGFLVEGSTSSFGAGLNDAWLFKIDSSGTPVWQKTYGTTQADSLFIQHAASGGYYFSGTYPVGGQAQFVLGKLDATGVIQWQKTYGAPGDGYTNMSVLSDGFLISGSKMVINPPVFGFVIRLIRTDASGAILWQKSYSDPTGAEQYMGTAFPYTGGGIMILGAKVGEDAMEPWFMKLDGSGNILWQKAYTMPEGQVSGGFPMPTADGGFLLQGMLMTGPEGSETSDLWLMKMNSSGAVQWQKRYGGAKDEFGVARELQGGGYIVTGTTDSFGAGGDDIWLMKLDASGGIVWQKTFGGPADDDGFLVEDPAGGYFLQGGTKSFGGGGEDIWILKLNASFDVIWQRAYGGSSDESGGAMRISGGGLLVSGDTKSFGAGDWDFFAAVLDSNGQLGNCPAFIHDTAVAPNAGTAAVSNTSVVEDTASVTASAGSATTGTGTVVAGTPNPTIKDICSSAPQLSASASAAPTSGSAPLVVAFTGSASNGTQPYSWAWTFGDGNGSSQQNSNHTYTSAGTYTATLTVTDATQATATASVTITVTGGGCTLTCTASVPAGGTAGAAVQFSASATPVNCQGALQWQWVFGDGQISSQQNPTHTYAAPGTYDWVMTAAIDNKTCTQSGRITITTGGGCTLSCEADVPPTGIKDTDIQFSGSETHSGCGAIATVIWLWTFGDGSQSMEQNPVHAYAATGSYPWTLTVTVVPAGTICQKRGTITITEEGECSLTCSASASPVVGAPPLTVSFTGSATATNCPGQVRYLWTFGDQTTPSTQQNPTHTYSEAGVYYWTMTATAGNAVCVKAGSVAVSAGGDLCNLVCTASAAPFAGGPPLTVDFSASATVNNCDGEIHYLWTFGDQTAPSTEQNPQHVYSDAGTYVWNLAVNSGNAVCTHTGTVTVSDSDLCSLSCTATATPISGAAPLAVTFRTVAVANNCSGSPVYLWTFGDGAADTKANTTHTYTQPGLYLWSLTTAIEDLICVQTGMITVASGGDCSLQCTATVPASGSTGNEIPFASTATVTNCTGAVTYHWDFGDGQNSALQNPVHAYANAGSYDWVLTVTVNNLTCIKRGTISIGGACTITCVITVPATGSAGQVLPFSSQGTTTTCAGAIAYEWNFGDGQTSTQPNPGHAYSNQGTYIWSVTATILDKICIKSGSIAIGPGGACTSDTAFPDWKAEYWNNNELSGTPVLVKNEAGDDIQRDWVEESPYQGCVNPDYFSVRWTRDLSFASSPAYRFRMGSDDGSRLFVDGSPDLFGATLWGVHSYEVKDIYLPLSAGTHRVVMEFFENEVYANALLQITPEQAPCSFTCSASAVPTSTPAPNSAKFSGSVGSYTCTGEPWYHWDFGDGGFSDEANPTYTYSQPGTYSWSLVVTGDEVVCYKTGTVTVGGSSGKPGDCDGNGTVSIGEVQKAINMFLGIQAPGCGVDCNGDGQVSIGEVQKVINAFLGLPASC